MHEFSVIMPCWLINEELIILTKDALDTLKDCELILIDNGSPLGGGFLRSHADIYVRNKENLGYAKAVNEGLKLAHGNYIAIANDDIRVSPNWQEVVKDIFAQDDKIFSVHPRMTDYDTPFAYGEKTVLTGKERWCGGSFFVIDSEKKQLYDEDFLNSYDDWDYFLRARTKGYYTVYTEKACFQHHHSFTQKFVPEREENNKRNAEVFKKKYGRYAEEIFAEMYPVQMQQDYVKGFDLT